MRWQAFEALAAENLALKRGVAERDMHREQADEGRRRWQDSERRLTEAQVGPRERRARGGGSKGWLGMGRAACLRKAHALLHGV